MATKSAVDIKSILGGCSGNLIEWYDWYAFAAFSIYFSGQFFPNQSPTIQLLNTAAIFATGFLMRPIGSYVMGVIADKHGRKNALTLSVLLMSLGSFLIAILPTQKTIGILAPILLTFIRLLQGFSLGGEYGISATYICEISNRKNRGFYSSFLYVTLIGGHLLAITVQVILQIFFLTDDQLKSWGWRIPFFIGSLLSLYVFYLRRKLVETDSFISEELSHDVKPVSIFKNPKVFFSVIGISIGGNVAFYTFSIYTKNFLINTVNFSKSSASLIFFFCLLFFASLQPLMGYISDKVGRKPVVIFFGVMGTIFTYPIFMWLKDAHSMWSAFFIVCFSLFIVSGYSSTSAVIKTEFFPAKIRALGTGFPYSISAALFGGTAEAIALWFKNIGTPQYFYYYVSGCIFISLLFYIFIPETKDNNFYTN